MPAGPRATRSAKADPLSGAPAEVGSLGGDLDHAEGLNFGPDGACYAGGEDGQVYRVSVEGEVTVYARTEGGIGGVCLDGHGNLYACN